MNKVQFYQVIHRHLFFYFKTGQYYNILFNLSVHLFDQISYFYDKPLDLIFLWVCFFFKMDFQGIRDLLVMYYFFFVLILYPLIWLYLHKFSPIYQVNRNAFLPLNQFPPHFSFYLSLFLASNHE